MKIIQHNALDPFPLPSNSVNLAITSPPYYQMRSYRDDPRQIGLEKEADCNGRKCGACYVCKMVKVASNLREVLAEDGSYFLNIGDCYNENKCLSFVPHRVALAMAADGWICRNTIIWHKPSPMPSSVKDRLNTTHEYVFHFTKNKRYYYNLNAIREPHKTLTPSKIVSSEQMMRKFGVSGGQNLLFDLAPQGAKYKKSKTADAERINVGARGGFVERGESVDNRYSDGGKNPGDYFLGSDEPQIVSADQAERKFTREDELRAAAEKGYTRRAAARVTARLSMGLAKNHPLGKNPGDYYDELVNIAHEENTESVHTAACDYLLDGYEAECPDCGTQFYTSVAGLRINNADDVWEIATEPTKVAHFATWPTKLAKRMILAASRPGDTVLDPFCGSGTSMIVAEQLSRIGIGFDLGYEDVRKERLSDGIQVNLTI